jgi:hypothetical protein
MPYLLGDAAGCPAAADQRDDLDAVDVLDGVEMLLPKAPAPASERSS